MSKDRMVKGRRHWVIVSLVLGLALTLMPSWAGGANLYVDFEITTDFPSRMSLTFDSAYIGSYMEGTLNQDGGTNTINNSLYLGRYFTGSGTYNLSGSGILSAGSEYIGNSGTGIFNQTGGANTVNNELIVAANQGSSGTYNLRGGSLTAGAIKVNPGGTFNKEGGFLDATTFWQAGGIVLGTLENKGNFIYDSGIFNGRLLNFGSITLNANFTAENGLLNDSAIPLQLTPAQVLTLNGLGLDNQTTIKMAGSTLRGSGPLVNNGILEGFGTISGSNGFTNNGNLLPNGGKLTLSTLGANLNNGKVEVAENASLELSKDVILTNNSPGTLQLNLGKVEGEGKLMNLGILTGKGSIATNFENTGKLLVQDGNINIDKAFTNSGLIMMESYTASLSGGAITNQGTIAGYGLVENSVVNDGLIEPSGSKLTIKAPVTNTSSGTVKVTTGNQLTLEEMPLPNQGNILIENGDLEINSGDLINEMVVNVNGGSLKVNGGFINKNSFQLGSLFVVEYIVNTGIITVASNIPGAVSKVNTSLLTNQGIMDILTKTEVTGKVENAGTLSIKADTQLAQEVENTGTLNIEAGVSAAKIANKASASLVLGTIDPAAATTLVAAPVTNEGLLDIIGKVEFASSVENKSKVSVAELADAKFTETVINEGLLDIVGTAEFAKVVDNKDTGTVSVAEQAEAKFTETVKNAGILAIEGKAEFAKAVENTGELALKAETKFTGDLENTGALAIEADLTAAKIANKETGSLKIGQLDPEAAATVVAAPVVNEGSLDIIGRTRVDGRVENDRTLAVKAKTEVTQEVENTGTLAIEADLTALKLANAENATLVLGKVDSAVATEVAAPVVNDGSLDIVGKTKVDGKVENTRTLAVKAETEVTQEVVNTGALTVEADLTALKLANAENATLVLGKADPAAATTEVAAPVVNDGSLDIVGKAKVTNVENAGTLAIKAETEVTQEVKNTGALTIEANLTALKLANAENATLVLGKADPAAATTVVAAPVVNDGSLDIVGKAKVTNVENAGTLAVKAETEVAQEVENTGILAVEANLKAATVKNTSTGKMVLGKAEAVPAMALQTAFEITYVDSPLVVNEGSVDIVGKTQLTGKVENAGTLAVKAETAVAQEVENTGALTIEADLTALKLANAENATLVLGKADPAAATTIVAAPVVNVGTLDVAGKVIFDKAVDNQNKVSIAQQADTKFNETVTNEGLLDIVGKAEFAKAVDNKNTGKVSIAPLADTKFNETVTNAGTLAIAGKAEFVKAVENTGEVSVADNAQVAFKEAVNWNGAYCSGVGTTVHTDLNIGENGCLMGPAGAKWEVSNDLTNQSTLPEMWDTKNCELAFVQDQVLGNDHYFSIMGADKGATTAGYDKNFAWGKVTIGEGQVVYLVDADDVLGGALYVGEIQGLTFGSPIITNIFGEDGINIYYDPTLPGNAYLEGLTYSLNTVPGEPTSYLLPTPVPASVLLLGSGLLGLGLLGWRRKSV
jgi:hypothetical protein